ncbi:MAG: hypothetical protein HS117_22495 [Verrucomicrobiaceae bacterium]|nr:hypothetical protein [Verrucomicrobiaceae bacterium]
MNTAKPAAPSVFPPWRDHKNPPPWLFPAPVRAGRFSIATPGTERFNIEVAPDRVSAFRFSGKCDPEVLHYDMQTQLLGNARGRLGSGRAGVYQGHYVKGAGRTPAAANWNDDADVYHGSGHLAIGSAIRERAITACLQARGLGALIVPCTAVLLGKLSPAEQRAVKQAQTSSRPSFTTADARCMALSVKPANFARMSNFAFALDRFEVEPRSIAELFLDLEYYLTPPEQRGDDAEGSPQSIVNALERAFERGLASFRAFSSAGLFWLYLESNFSLDGRFLDLETPVYFGQPFVGISVSTVRGGIEREVLGFEEFGFAGHWRGFIAWLTARLRLLCLRESGCGREVRSYLGGLLRAIERRFSARHLLYDDRALMQQATAHLAGGLGLEAADRKRLRALARHVFDVRVYNHVAACPELGWKEVTTPPADATPRKRNFLHAPFSPGAASDGGLDYARMIARLSQEKDPHKLLRGFEP